MKNSTFAGSLLNSFREETIKWLIGIFLAIFTLYSNEIIESIEFSLKKSEIRIEQYEEMAQDISNYLYATELMIEFIEKGWTTSQTLLDVSGEYNKYVINIRKKEYLYYAWVRKYWPQKAKNSLSRFMVNLRNLDKSLHLFNDEFETVNVTKKKEKIDPVIVKEIMLKIKPIEQKVKETGNNFLESLL